MIDAFFEEVFNGAVEVLKISWGFAGFFEGSGVGDLGPAWARGQHDHGGGWICGGEVDIHFGLAPGQGGMAAAEDFEDHSV